MTILNKLFFFLVLFVWTLVYMEVLCWNLERISIKKILFLCFDSLNIHQHLNGKILIPFVWVHHVNVIKIRTHTSNNEKKFFVLSIYSINLTSCESPRSQIRETAITSCIFPYELSNSIVIDDPKPIHASFSNEGNFNIFFSCKFNHQTKNMLSWFIATTNEKRWKFYLLPSIVPKSFFFKAIHIFIIFNYYWYKIKANSWIIYRWKKFQFEISNQTISFSLFFLF